MTKLRDYTALRATPLVEWIERLRNEAGEDFPEKVTAFRPEMATHGRYKEPCPRCGTKIQRIRYAANRNKLLSYLPNRRKTACRSSSVATVAGRLAQNCGRAWVSRSSAIKWIRADVAVGSATPMRGKSMTCRKPWLRIWRSMTAEDWVMDPEKKERPHRQVIDLPRIRVAEPVTPLRNEGILLHPVRWPNRHRNETITREMVDPR